jgi:tetratricopeptide (TPR) repeat protein
VDRARIFWSSAEGMSREEYLRFIKKAEIFAKQKKDKFLKQHIEHMHNHLKAVQDLSFEEEIIAVQNLLQQYQEDGKNLEVGYCHHVLAQLHFWLREYGHSFEHYFKAYEIFEKVGFENVPTITKFLHDMALSRYFFKDYKEVIRLMHLSRKYTPYNENHHIQLHNNLGAAYKELGVKDSALFYFKKTLELSKKYNYRVWEGISLGNIGNVYFNDKNYEQAHQYYLLEFDISKENHTDPIWLSSYINISKTYVKLDSLAKAKVFLKQISDKLQNLQKDKLYGENEHLKSLQRNFYEIMTEYAQQSGDYKLALQFKDSLNSAQQKIDSTFNSAIVKMSADKLLIQAKDLELAQKEQEKSSQRLMYLLIISLGLIFGVLSYLYMYKSRQRKKRQNERLLSQNKITLLEKQKAEKELQLAKSQIQHFVDKISENSKIITELESDLYYLKNLEIEQKQQVSQTLQNLKSAKILNDQDWYEFQNNFDAAFPDFTISIKNKVPSITVSELRYLMMVQLSLSNKEMARAIGVSDSSIRVTWNRVRKKLNGTPDDTPEILLEKILTKKRGKSRKSDVE